MRQGLCAFLGPWGKEGAVWGFLCLADVAALGLLNIGSSYESLNRE